MNKFGEVLKGLRKEKGLTQREIADKSEVSYSSIQKLETGLVEPTVISIDKLAKALEVDPMKLFLNTPDGEIVYEWFV